MGKYQREGGARGEENRRGENTDPTHPTGKSGSDRPSSSSLFSLRYSLEIGFCHLLCAWAAQSTIPVPGDKGVYRPKTNRLSPPYLPTTNKLLQVNCVCLFVWLLDFSEVHFCLLNTILMPLRYSLEIAFGWFCLVPASFLPQLPICHLIKRFSFTVLSLSQDKGRLLRW